MINHWEIKPEPHGSDSERQRLYIDGNMRDITLILKKLGRTCGRPEKITAPYTYAMYLFKIDSKNFRKIEENIAEAVAESGKKKRSSVVITNQNVLQSPAKEEKKVLISPHIEAERVVNAGQTVQEPPVVVETSAEEYISAPPAVRRKTRQPPPIPTETARIIIPAKTTRHRRHKYPPEIPLIPVYTFNTLIAGSNRFAHAASMSVLENPGSMYNPLVLYGHSGTGKSHFLNAIAYGLGDVVGQENIFLTDGVRFPRATQRLVSEGKIDELDSMMENISAVFIDDIHLMAISDDSKPYISKWLNNLLDRGKQIVITSAYPLRSLTKLENSLDFQLNQGWIVDLKLPSKANYQIVIKRILKSSGVILSEDETGKYFDSDKISLSQALDRIHRLKVLEKLVSEQPTQHNALLDMIIGIGEEDCDGVPSTEDLAQANDFHSENGRLGRWGFFCPKGEHEYLQWVAYNIKEKALEYGIKDGFEILCKYEYETENLIASAFKIADICQQKELQGAVIIGCPADTDKKMQTDFADVLKHMLNSMLVRCGYIEYEQMSSPSAYLRMVLNLIR